MLDGADIGEFLGDLPEVFQRDLGILDFTPTKADPDTDLLAFVQPAARISNFKRTVVLGCLWAKADFFDLDFRLCFPRFAIFLCLLVQELSVIQHPADGRVGIRCNFDKIQIGFVRDPKGFLDGYDTNVISIRTDEAYLARSYVFVDPIF